jgi:hypothetical protein
LLVLGNGFEGLNQDFLDLFREVFNVVCN